MWHYQERRPLVFNHIPKTAGTSLMEALLTALRPDRHARVLDGVVLGDLDHLETMRRRARNMVVAEGGQLDLDLQFVTGHVSPSTTMGRFPEATHITFLREPRTRILSLWLFSRSRPPRESRLWGHYGQPIGRARQPLVEYLDDPDVALGVDNMITRFLLWPHPLIMADEFIDPRNDAVLLEQARSRLSEFAFVGVVEDPTTADRLGEFLGVPVTVPRRNEGLVFRRGDDVDVERSADSAADLLTLRSRLDRQLWDDVVQQTLPGENAVELANRTFRDAVTRHAMLASEPRRPRIAGLARRLRRRAPFPRTASGAS